MSKDPLTASRDELAAARHLAAGGFHGQAVSRAYFAAFRAAKAALSAVGEDRSKHAGVIAAFVHSVVKQGSLDAEAGRLLNSLFERRKTADYEFGEATTRQADRAIEDAQRFVDAVAGWLGARGSA